MYASYLSVAVFFTNTLRLQTHHDAIFCIHYTQGLFQKKGSSYH